jgi:hypothetical protein
MLVAIYLKAWNARLVPYQSQKTVRTTPGNGDCFQGGLLLHATHGLSVKNIVVHQLEMSANYAEGVR